MGDVSVSHVRGLGYVLLLHLADLTVLLTNS